MTKLIKITLIFVFTYVLIPNSTFAQKVKIVDLEREADLHFRINNFFAAQPLFKQLDSLVPNQEKYMYPLGVCYIAQDDNINALKYLEKCLANSSNHPAAFNFYLAKAYHLSHKFEDAIKYYQLYQNEFKDKKSKTNQQLVEEVNRDIEMCQNGIELLKNPIEIEIVNIGGEINTKWPEYGPVLSADETEIIFTSARPDTKGGKQDPGDGTYYEDVYISYKKEGKWSKPISLSAVNTNNHDASIALSPDGQLMFTYMFDGSSGDLYQSKLVGSKWTTPEKLSDKINSKYWEPSATVNEDGTLLIFTSNKPGGLGGTDLYASKKLSDGSWDAPELLSDIINTKYDEDAPFLHPDGKTLYFSSKGHNSMGGFDIFYSKLDENTGEWTKPVNMGYPISSAHEDLHFAITPDGRRIYFSSSKEGGFGDKDIYIANIKSNKTSEVLLATGVVSDGISKKPVTASIKVLDKTTGDEIGNFTSNSVTGKYTFVLSEGKVYEVLYTSPKYGSHYELIDLSKETEFKNVVLDVALKPSKRNVKIKISDAESDNVIKSTVKLRNSATNEVVTMKETSDAGIYEAEANQGNYYHIEVSKPGYVFYDSEIEIPTDEQTSKDSVPAFDIKLSPIKEGAAIVLKNIYFASDEAKPLHTSNTELDKLVELLKTNPNLVIEIAAHTDDKGDDNYNLKLSDSRAKSVMNYLVEKGIDNKRLTAKGYGESKPVANGKTEKDRALNRRVEFIVLKK